MNIHGITTMTPMSKQATNPPASTNSTNGTNGTGSINQLANQTAAQAESTFINLLVTELQAQDPTQPMDPNQMVSQMFSMNQLEQLININQTLTTAFPPPTTTSSSPSTGGTSNNSVPTGAN